MSAYRGTGDGSPLVLLHGLTGAWPIWRPVLGALEAEHRVFAPTLPGHHGADGLPEGMPASVDVLADALEAQLDAEGIDRAHLVGNSLGGWLALELSRRGRALSVVALSPGGAWETEKDLVRVVRLIGTSVKVTARFSGAAKRLARRPRARRLLLRSAMEHGDRIPYREVEALLDAAIGCAVLPAFLDGITSSRSFATSDGPADHPIRIAWAEHDRTISFERYGRPMVAAVHGCELVHLPGVGHVPMYDDPALVARTILEVTRAADRRTTTPSQTETRMTPTPTFTGSQGAIHLHHWSATDPTFGVVLAHGYGEHAGRYAHVADRLVAEGAIVVAPDHHGHGRSEGPRAHATSLEPMVDDLQAVSAKLRERHPDLPMVLIGHSMGGILATRLAQRDPSAWAALVLSGPAIGGNPQIQGMMAMDPLPEVPIDPAILSNDPAVGEAYMADELVYHGPFQRETLEALFGAVDVIAAGPSFGALPTLWVHGSEDQLAPLDATRTAIDHLRGDLLEEHIYPGAQHEVFNEVNRDEVLDDVVRFVKAQLPA